MSQPPYPPQDPQGYPPPGQPSYPPPGDPHSGAQGGYPPPEQGQYPQQHAQGQHPAQPGPGQYQPGPGQYAAQPGQGQYPPSAPGGYPPPGQAAYPPADQGLGSAPGYPPPGDQGFGSAPGYPPPADQGFGSAPGYPPPGDQGFGSAPGFPPPKKKSRALPIILISLGIVVVLCAGAAIGGYFLFRDEVGAGVAATTTRLVTPTTLGGRPKLNDPQFSAITEQLTSELNRSVPGSTSTVGALYGNPLEQDIVLVAGASAPVTDPEKELDRFFSSMGGSGMTITDVAPIEAGPLGGVAKCGNADSSGVKLAVCGWADQGSVAMIGTFFKTADEVAGEFPALRAEIEKKE